MRNEFAWKFTKESTTFSLLDSPWQQMYSLDKQKYSYFDSLFAFGFDTRYQTTRSFKTSDAQRKYYFMQAGLYVNTNPFKWLFIEGQKNFGPIVFYGQTDWMASAIIKPDKSIPALRIGRFQPSIGLRDCDMASLDRRLPVPDGTEQFIAPDYSEFGAELIYEPNDWLTMNLGMHDSRNLRLQKVFGSSLQTVPEANDHIYTFKAMFFPEWLWENFPAAFIGGSILKCAKFYDYNLFVGYSLTDRLYLQLKYAGSSLNGDVAGVNTSRLTNSYIAGLTYMPVKGIYLEARAETGNTNLENSNIDLYNIRTNQYVITAKILPIPYLEFIPEYRIIDCIEYRSGRWGMQVHLYY